MSILVKSGNKQLVVSGINAGLKYTEGPIRLPLPIIDFDNKGNFNQLITFTFTVTDPNDWVFNITSEPSQANNITIDKAGNIYTLSGNNWKYLREHLSSLYLETTDDNNSNITVDIVASDGVSVDINGQVTYTGTPTFDRTWLDAGDGTEDLPYEFKYDEDSIYKLSAKDGFILKPDDKSGAQTNKEYRVTLTPDDPSGIKSYINANSTFKTDVADFNTEFPHLSARVYTNGSFNIFSYQTYYRSGVNAWDFAEILGESNDTYTITLTVSDVNFGVLTNSQLVDEGLGVYTINGTRDQINPVLAAIEYSVNLGYVDQTTIIFNQFNDSTGTDEGSRTINLYYLDGIGAGYLFKSTDQGSNWTLEHKFLPEISMINGEFGQTVSCDISSESKTITFNGNNGGKYTEGTGSCYVSGWDKIESASKIPKMDRSTDQVGNIDVSGLYYVDVALLNDNGEQFILQGFDTDPGDFFGFQVKLSSDGKLLFVTAPNDTDISKGTVYVFKRSFNEGQITLPGDSCGVSLDDSSVSWDQIDSFNGTPLTDLTRFGTEIEIVDYIGNPAICAGPQMGEYVFVTSEEEDDSGAVYVFKRTGETTWTQMSVVKSDTPTPGAFFGNDVCVHVERNELTGVADTIWMVVGEPFSSLDVTSNVDANKVVTIEGNHNAITSVLDNLYVVSSADGEVSYNMTYTQEVIGGNPVVPYVQESTSVLYSIDQTHDEAQVNLLVDSANEGGDNIVHTPGQIIDQRSESFLNFDQTNIYDNSVFDQDILYDVRLKYDNLTVFPTEGVNLGSGEYQFAGTKDQVNDMLFNLETNVTDAVGDFTVTYSQTQTTDSIVQATDIICMDITVFDVQDAININQSNDIIEDTIVWKFDVQGKGAPQVQDQLGPGSGRTYQITFSPEAGSEGLYKIFVDHPLATQQYEDTVTFSGSENDVNDIMAGGSGGAFHVDTIEDNILPFNIVYTQEVISGAPGVPFTQENGLFLFTTIAQDNFVVNGPFTYDEDIILTFTPGQILEPNFTRNYKVTLTLSDPNAGTLDFGTNEGGGVWSFTGTNSVVNTELNNMTFTPSADYSSNFTIAFNLINADNMLDKGTENIDMNFGVASSNYELNGPFVFNEDEMVTFTPGQITDLRADIDPFTQYQVDLTLSDPAAGSLSQSQFIGTKDDINTAMTNIIFTPSADYISGFSINYAQQNTSNSVSQGDDDITFNIGLTHDEYTLDTGPINWLQNGNNLINVAQITDERPGVNYEVICQMQLLNTFGEFRTFGTGGTANWEPANDRIVITGTKDEVNSHLDSLQFWPYKDVTSAFTWLYTQTQTDDSIVQANNNQVSMAVGTIQPSPINTNLTRLYDEDDITEMNDENKVK